MMHQNVSIFAPLRVWGIIPMSVQRYKNALRRRLARRGLPGNLICLKAHRYNAFGANRKRMENITRQLSGK